MTDPPEVSPAAGPTPRVSAILICKVLGKMKCTKATGFSGILAQMLKAADEEVVELLRQLTEAVFSSGETSADWEENFSLNLYKGKGEALDHGNYQ